MPRLCHVFYEGMHFYEQLVVEVNKDELVQYKRHEHNNFIKEGKPLAYSKASIKAIMYAGNIFV